MCTKDQIMGTQGEIIGGMDKGAFTLYRYLTGEQVEVPAMWKATVTAAATSAWSLRSCTACVVDSNPSQGLTSATASLQSHLTAFASEHSRLNDGMAIKLADLYRTEAILA